MEASQYAPLERLYDTVPQFLRSVPQFLREIKFRVVERTSELRAASNLVYREYVKRGYIQPNAARLKLSLYHALPDTTTFIAIHRKTGVLGTLSLIQDSSLGLPMDEVYKSELDAMRRQGHQIAEASMLSFDSTLLNSNALPTFHAKKMVLTLRLFKVMFDYLRSCTTATELVACFNPKHQILYEFLHMQPLGGLKSYSIVSGNPAVARHLNVSETQRLAAIYPVLEFFYGEVSARRRFLRRLQLSLQDLQELFLRVCPILASLSPSEAEYLRRCYPEFALESLLQTSLAPDLSHAPAL